MNPVIVSFTDGDNSTVEAEVDFEPRDDLVGFTGAINVVSYRVDGVDVEPNPEQEEAVREQALIEAFPEDYRI
jgi:hypothetical protein